MAWLLPVVAALTLLLITPHALFSFDVTPKAVVLLAGAGLALVISRPAWNGVRSLAGTRAGRWFLWILGGQLFALILSTALSSHPALSLFGSTWRRFGLVGQAAVLAFGLMLAGEAAVRRGTAIVFLRTLAVSGAAASLYGILQYFGVDPLLTSASYHIGEGVWTIVRPPSTLGHASYFATVLLYSAFSGVAAAAGESSVRWRWICRIAAGLCVCAIVLSGTRSAMAGLAAGAILLAWRQRPKLRRTHAAAALIIVAGAAAFYFSPAGLKLRGRTRWFTEDRLGGARPLLWRDSAAMAAAAPVAGIGPESFQMDFGRYQSIELARAYPDFYQESAHNIFLDALVSQGVIGLAALAALSAFVLLGYRGTTEAWHPAACCGFAAALLSQQFISFTLPTAMCFYATAALLAATRETPAPRRARASLRWGGTLPALAFLAVAAKLAVSDAYLARAKDHIDAGRLDAGIAAHLKGVDWALPGSSVDLYFSRALLRLSSQQTQATEKFRAWQWAMGAAARAASQSEERANSLVNLAAFQAGLNDSASVERSLKAAEREAPHWFRPKWLLARLFLTTGRLAEAEAAARQAVDCNGGHDAEVLQTFRKILEMRGK